jgi:2'-5' RNA ligase
MSFSMNPLLVTLEMDATTFARLDALRNRYFPPERNVVPAHVSLFHQLPRDEEARVREVLASVASEHPPIPLRLTTLKKTGRGMAIAVEAAGLATLHARLAREFAEWLTPQDRQPYRPHVTIMNKAEPYQASLAFQELGASWEPWTGEGQGLFLWEYLGGPWRRIGRYPFTLA